MTVDVGLDLSGPGQRPVFALLHRSSVGAHVALCYRAGTDAGHRVLEQAWHFDTRDQTLEDFLKSAPRCLPVRGVEPTALDEDERDALRAACARVARHVGQVTLPYALNARDARIGEDGSVSLGTAQGLTCATFLLCVFEVARVQLLDTSTWDTGRSEARQREDQKAQETIVAGLRITAGREADPQTRDAYRRHAAAVEAEVGCTRIRAEEVAAASGLGPLPADYATTEPAGQRLRVGCTSPTAPPGLPATFRLA